MQHTPILAFVIPLMLVSLFFRMRRNLGRQAVRPTQMIIRIVLLSIAVVAFGFLPSFDLHLVLSMLAGVLLGVGLALVGLRHTRFETTGAGRFYRPNTYVGLVVTALFVGRVAYRLIVLAPEIDAARQAGAASTGASHAMMFDSSRTPLTLALFGLVVGYYVSYYIGVLIRSARQTASVESRTSPEPLA